MNILYGDMFEYAEASKRAVIIHGCNCRGAFGAGVAGLIRNRYPRVYDAYSDEHVKGKLVPGYVSWAKATNTILVANACTQVHPGADAKVEHIHNCITEILARLQELSMNNFVHGTDIFFPAIGCGIGGLRLEDVKDEFERLDLLTKFGYTVNLVLLDKEYLCG